MGPHARSVRVAQAVDVYAECTYIRIGEGGQLSAAEDLRKHDRIQLRANARQMREIDEAAAAENKTRSDFMLEASVEQARRVLADRRIFLLGDRERDEFLALLDRPPTAKPRLRALSERGSVLVDE